MKYSSVFKSLLIIMNSGCATSRYEVTTTPPEAKVEAIYLSGSKKEFGATPMKIDADTANPNNESFRLEISKEGFEKQSVFIPGSYYQKNVVINANLIPTMVNLDLKKSEQRLNDVAAAVADLQRDIQAKNYDVALGKIERLNIENPGVATFHSLAGNIYYLQKRFEKALASYRRSAQLNPPSTEVSRVIEKLESMNTGGSR